MDREQHHHSSSRVRRCTVPAQKQTSMHRKKLTMMRVSPHELIFYDIELMRVSPHELIFYDIELP